MLLHVLTDHLCVNVWFPPGLGQVSLFFPLPNLIPARCMMEVPSLTRLIAMHVAVKISFSFQKQKVCQLV